MRYSILIILAAWVATIFSGEQHPQEIDAGVGPPIEIRLGFEDGNALDRALPIALNATRKNTAIDAPQ